MNSEYLKRTAQSAGVRAVKRRALEFLELAPGGRVVDVGCGPAIDTVQMAEAVGPTGRVLGVDHDPSMVDEANRIAVEMGVGAVARHVVGNAAALALGSEDFDACYCERLLQHLPGAAVGSAAREMLRVVRPGGRVAAVDTDWATLSIASANPWLERRVVGEHALQFPNPFSGRSLLPLFRSAGLVDMTVESFGLTLSADALEFLLAPALESGVESGRISRLEAQQWLAEGRLASEYGTFFAHVMMVLTTGCKPAHS